MNEHLAVLKNLRQAIAILRVARMNVSDECDFAWRKNDRAMDYLQCQCVEHEVAITDYFAPESEVAA